MDERAGRCFFEFLSLATDVLGQKPDELANREMLF